MNRHTVSLAAFAAATVVSMSAFAQDEDKSATKPPAPSVGYLFEAGVASTHLVHGAAKYDTKSTPATEDVAIVRVKDLGPGTLQVGTSFALALASTTAKHQKSEEVLPCVTYGGAIGALRAEGGMRIWFYPRMDQTRQDVEGVARFSVPNRYVTPTLDLYPSFAEKQGIYGYVGAERNVELASWLSIKPRISFGEQGYDFKSERLHAQDVAVSAALTALFGSGVFAAIRPMYSTLAGPSHYYKDPSFGGRSVAYLGFAMGAQR